MVRPHKCRRIAAQPCAAAFKPHGVPGHALETVELRLDELEAIRLGDLEGLYQDAAAEQMGVSRATFARLLAGARQKVADALLNGKMITFSGGQVVMMDTRTFECGGCCHRFQVPHGTGRPTACPACQCENIHRATEERRRRRGRCRGAGRGRRQRQGNRCCQGSAPQDAGSPQSDAPPPSQENNA